MDEKLYSVSEAVRLIGVESHVLRYWEEELNIPIQRTSLGHRTYSEKNIETFRQVKDWKQKGIQLKAIRLLLEETPGMESALHTVAYREAEHGANPEPAQMRNVAENCGFEKKEADVVETERIEIKNTRSAIERERYSDSNPTGPHKSEENNPTGHHKNEEKNATDQTEGKNWEKASDEERRELIYEIISTEEPQDDMEKAIQLLKQMMEEVVGEQNKKLEEQLIEQLRDEMELLYLQYLQAMQEAAASREKEEGKIKKIFRRFFPGTK